MKSTIVTALLLPAVVLAASPKLRLGYFGHAMVEIVLPSGTRIITDPFDLTTGPAFPNGVNADVVVMSHNHFDHANSAAIGGSPALISWANGSACAIDFTATPSKHFPTGTEGENHLMTWQADGLKFGHLGDYGDVLSAGDSTVLASSSFLFIPVGGAFTINAAQADTIISKVRPKIAFPIHYKTPDHGAGFAPLATLQQANGSFTFPVVVKSSWLAIDPAELPEGPVYWEPPHSNQLPGDLEALSISFIGSRTAPGISIEVKNNAPRSADGARLILTVYDSTSLVQAETTTINVSAGQDRTFDFPFTATATGSYLVTGEVVYGPDEVPPNDTVSTTVDFVGLAEPDPRPAPGLEAGWQTDGALVVTHGSLTGTASLALYDAQGRVVNRFTPEVGARGVIRWLPSSPLAPGSYFLKLTDGRVSLTRKLVLIRRAD